MKLHVTALLALLLTTACKTTEQPHKDSRFTRHMDAQGPITITELQQSYAIFSVKRSNQPNPQAVEFLNQITQPTQITAFFGTWCHDSQREIPNLIKLKEALNNPNIQLQLIALDRNKQDEQGRARQANIAFTPTIIVSRNQQELGRIVEKTTQAIGLELVQIIQSAKE